RHCILTDLSPIASFVAYNYTTPSSALQGRRRANELVRTVFDEMRWQYQTLHAPTEEQIESAISRIQTEDEPDLSNCGTLGYVNYTVWSDVFSCPECAH